MRGEPWTLFNQVIKIKDFLILVVCKAPRRGLHDCIEQHRNIRLRPLPPPPPRVNPDPALHRIDLVEDSAGEAHLGSHLRFVQKYTCKV